MSQRAHKTEVIQSADRAETSQSTAEAGTALSAPSAVREPLAKLLGLIEEGLSLGANVLTDSQRYRSDILPQVVGCLLILYATVRGWINAPPSNWTIEYCTTLVAGILLISMGAYFRSRALEVQGQVHENSTKAASDIIASGGPFR